MKTTTLGTPQIPARLLRSHTQLMDQMIPELEIVDINYRDHTFNQIIRKMYLDDKRAVIPRVLRQ